MQQSAPHHPTPPCNSGSRKCLVIAYLGTAYLPSLIELDCAAVVDGKEMPLPRFSLADTGNALLVFQSWEELLCCRVLSQSTRTTGQENKQTIFITLFSGVETEPIQLVQRKRTQMALAADVFANVPRS